MSQSSRVAGLLALAVATAIAGQALAWGASGHRLVGQAAMLGLPDEVPAFLRSPVSVAKVGELAREPDRWKNAGKTHDSDLDPGHFTSLDDAGKIVGGPPLSALPPTRGEYETSLRAAGGDSWKAGYLPYSIIEGWQQIAKDFTYLRADESAATSPATSAEHKAWFVTDAAERRELLLRDIGVLAHYVGDGSQPLHVSIHYNGWGPFPNPNNYTQDHIHAPFEGELVHRSVTLEAVRAKMAPVKDCECAIEARTADYLATTGAQAIPLYDLQKAGGLSAGDPRGAAFATQRLAAGADELRDLIVMAWRASEQGEVGWKPAYKVSDIEAGKVDPYESMFGVD
ncbi:S1/P1 Nuclease [Caulobacter sp. KR2-114]|uniref:S1/P1 Nuclease n=1 Tax=Caulobacter sp. KR2-114 TaxID=3400912 RepID=UPI003C0495BE